MSHVCASLVVIWFSHLRYNAYALGQYNAYAKGHIHHVYGILSRFTNQTLRSFENSSMTTDDGNIFHSRLKLNNYNFGINNQQKNIDK